MGNQLRLAAPGWSMASQSMASQMRLLLHRPSFSELILNLGGNAHLSLICKNLSAPFLERNMKLSRNVFSLEARCRAMMARSIGVTMLVALLGGVTLPARAEAGETRVESTARPRTGTAIKSIIPHRRAGDEACYAGTFSGQTIDIADWAHPTLEILPDVIVGGQPATRPLPRSLPKQDISQIALHLTYRIKRGGSWDFDFTLMAGSNSLNDELFARSGCAWSGWNGEKDVRPEFKLACWIECDGGGFTAGRIAGTRSLDLRFHALAMQSGCEGGGRYRVGTGETYDTVKFRLEPAPLSVCRRAKSWDRKR
jgi:hypothetical protein